MAQNRSLSIARVASLVVACVLLTACGASTVKKPADIDPFASISPPVREYQQQGLNVRLYDTEGDWGYADSVAVFPPQISGLEREFIGSYDMPTRDVFVRYEGQSDCRVTIYVYLPAGPYESMTHLVAGYTVAAAMEMESVGIEVLLEPSVSGDEPTVMGVVAGASAREDGDFDAHFAIVSFDGKWLYKARITAEHSASAACMVSARELMEVTFPPLPEEPVE